MIVVLHSTQLESIVFHSIRNDLGMVPSNLNIDSRYFLKNQKHWDVSADFDNDGIHHTIRLRINPSNGKVVQVNVPGDNSP